MTNNIISVSRTSTAAPKQVRRNKPVSTVSPIASPFAVKMSDLLRKANRQKQEKMIAALHRAGKTIIDGWKIADLIVGRINPETGDRILPNGERATYVTPSGGADGRYYGSRTHAPVTSLYQTGVIWQSAS